jgi:O-acetylserine/cysteine efflux transporter
MSPRHVLLATLVAALWGFNFVIIDVGLGELPPLAFAALRFAAAAIPAVFLVRRPQVAWKWIITVGMFIGVGQFGLLFVGMHQGMPAGLSSVVLQTQALFTMLFAGALLRERPRVVQVAGMVIALAGVVLIGVTFGQSSPIVAFILCLGGAAMWGLGNVAMRKARPDDALGFMVWMSLVPPLPLLALSAIFEGPRAAWDGLTNLSLSGVGALAYIAYISTLFGFGAWGWLMRRYDAGQVAMYSLLVPPFGLTFAALVLGEPLTAVNLFAATLIVGGVALGSLRRPTSRLSTVGRHSTGHEPRSDPRILSDLRGRHSVVDHRVGQAQRTRVDQQPVE